MGVKLAQTQGKGLLRGVVQMGLAAQEQHLVAQKRLPQGIDHRLRQVGRQAEVADFGPDTGGHGQDVSRAQRVERLMQGHGRGPFGQADAGHAKGVLATSGM